MPGTVTFSARVDSGAANNPALNLTVADAVELTFIAETDTGGAGDLFLDQPGGGGVDPDTQVEIGGTAFTFSFVYELNGTLPTENADGAQQVPEEYKGSDVVVISVQDYPSAGESTRYAFMPNESASLADMDAFGNGAIDIQNVDDTPESMAICFLKGSLILTPSGEVPVEEFGVGDLVQTVDDGPTPVRWISFTSYLWPGASEKSKPILVPAGAFGEGRPRRDLMVSPQHRFLLAGDDVERMFGCKEVLAPAKCLTSLPGIRVMKGKREATYYHLLLDRHCLLTAEGALTKSFFPGPTALKLLSRGQRREILQYFPALEKNPETGYGPMARRKLSRRETEALLDGRRRSRNLRAIAPRLECVRHRPELVALSV